MVFLIDLIALRANADRHDPASPSGRVDDRPPSCSMFDLRCSISDLAPPGSVHDK